MGLYYSVNSFSLLYTLSNNIGIYVYISYVFVHSRQLRSAKLIVLRENNPFKTSVRHRKNPKQSRVVAVDSYTVKFRK